MRKRLIHFHNIGSRFSMICEGKGASGEILNCLKTKKRNEVTCKKCLKKINQ